MLRRSSRVLISNYCTTERESCCTPDSRCTYKCCTGPVSLFGCTIETKSNCGTSPMVFQRIILLFFICLYLTYGSMGLNVRGYQFHLLQRCHPTCALSGSRLRIFMQGQHSYTAPTNGYILHTRYSRSHALTLSDTVQARIKILICEESNSRLRTCDPRDYHYCPLLTVHHSEDVVQKQL